MNKNQKKRMQELAKEYSIFAGHDHRLRWHKNKTYSVMCSRDFEAGFTAALSDPDIKAEREDYREALLGILKNVSLDWYLQYFSKDERPTGTTIGVVAKIHNQDTLGRIKSAFIKAQASLDRWEGKNDAPRTK